MKIRNGLLAAVAALLVVPATAQATQTVNFANITRNGTAVTSPVFVVSGDVLKFDASLTANGASNPPNTTGLGLCLEYKQSAVNDPTIANLLTTDLAANGTPTAISGCTAGGSTLTPGADFMVVKGYLNISGSWPGVALPVKIYDAQFTLPATPTGSTQIGFGASSVAAGETFTSNGPLVVCGKPTVTVNKTADGSEAGPTAATFDVILSAAIPAECGTAGSFPVSLTLGGTATVPGQPNADYTISGTNVFGSGASVTANFPANGSTTTITVIATPVDDALVEGTETVSLTVAAGSGSYLGVGNSATANITDNDQSISVAVTQNGAEGGPDGIFTFTRTGATAGPLTVNFTLTGTATTPADYTVSAGAGASGATTTSITFNAGATTAVLNVLVVDDALIEGTETAILTVGAGAGYSIAGTNPVTMNLTDNDVPPVVSVSAHTNGAEPSTNGSFTITRATNLTPAVPLNFTIGGTATRGTDYTLSLDNCGTTLSANTLTIPASQTTVTVTICVIDDVLVEGTETVIFTIAAPTSPNDYTIGAPNAQTANITDDDGPVTVTIVATTQAAEPATNGLFTVTRNGGGVAQLAQPLVVNLAASGTATPGTDYQAIPPTVTILANQTTATIPVNVIDDALVEGTETVIVTLQAGSYTVGSPSSATVNIADDDVQIAVSIAATIPNAAEPATNGQFTVTRTSGSVMQNAQAYVVNLGIGGTATNGTDYQTIPNTVTVLANQTTATIPVTVIDDNLVEGNETVVLTVLSGTGYVVGAPSSAIVTIADDEIGISVTTIADAIEGGTPGVFRICRTGSTAAPLTVSFTLGGNAVQGADYTLSGNVGNTVVIPAGSACADLGVIAVNDTIQNSNRTVSITLVAGGGAQVVPGGGVAAMTLIDNDQPTVVPTLSLQALILLGLVLAMAAGFSMRRRRS